ncbi:MAG: serine/threonine protein kinase [Kofleriaceae bacterium]|nr:serine/threonine protein kinase [Myxococcales bacterium]MCB9559351.1 serine/threonine protein kinase [Kofleriaceae bacterium]MCB9574035.1 serine/threonine protein kinase [Kofleriaceae bacterium]
MSDGGTGDDGRAQPSGSNPAVPRAAAPTPGKLVVRTGEGASDSHVMGAADTAMAMAVSHDSEPGDPVHTDPDVRTTAGDGDEDYLLNTTLLGRYQITKKIGQGGMGAVYEATHTLIGKRVAVKVLLDKYIKKDQVVARLEQEARLASSIGHEHIIDITDFGQTSDGRTFVVMEFLEGESLAECLAREGSLPERRILEITAQIASALSAAHAKGIVHRDIKPENVFLLQRKDKDFAKVVDFGISKNLRSTGEGEDASPRLTQTGMVLGTPLYMSPEQARGDDALDHRIDVYALGVIMYELATGQVPFSGTNYLSVISQVLNDDPVPPRQVRPELSEEFEAVVLRALEKDRERRYQSTDELLADVTALLDDPMRSTQRPRIVAPRRTRRGRGLRVLAWIAGVSVVIAAVAVTVSFTMGGGGKPRAAVAVDAGVAAIVIDAAPPIDAPPVPPQPKVEVTTIWIDTEPTGAMLYEGDRELGRAPLAYDAQLDSEKIELIAVLDKYDDGRVTIRPLVDRKHDTQDNPVKVKLTKTKAGAVKKVIKRGAGGAGSGTGTGTGSGSGTGTGTKSSGGTGGGGDLEGNPYTRKQSP